jgi:transcriptional regulator with XRE-family HTH domain
MADSPDPQDFARVFGSALAQFLKDKGMKQSEAVRELGLEMNKGKARLNTYCRGTSKGSWPTPDAKILYLLCARLGFAFKYNGYTISAATLNGNGAKPVEKPVEQLQIQFDGQFNLTDQHGTVSISVKRPAGRIAVALSLKGVS